SGDDLETSVLPRRVVEKQHRRRDPRCGGRQIGPVGEILMQNDRPALVRALEIELLGKKGNLLFSDHVLARLDESRVESPSMKLLAQMGERLEALHQIGIVGLPFHDRLETPLQLEHVTADAMLSAPLLRKHPLHHRFARPPYRVEFASVKSPAPHHEPVLRNTLALAGIKPHRSTHRFSPLYRSITVL